MGIESLLLLGIGAASAVSQRSQARKAARNQRTANAIQTASGTIENRLSSRRAAREERVRRARLLQGAENSGITGGSGIAGSLSALNSNLGAAQAGQRSQELASRGISAALQRRADAISAGNNIRSFANLAKTAVGVAGDAGLLE